MLLSELEKGLSIIVKYGDSDVTYDHFRKNAMFRWIRS